MFRKLFKPTIVLAAMLALLLGPAGTSGRALASHVQPYNPVSCALGFTDYCLHGGGGGDDGEDDDTPSDDSDGDGVPDDQDNCPGRANPGQQDSDRDGKGDACDENATRLFDGPFVMYKQDGTNYIQFYSAKGALIGGFGSNEAVGLLLYRLYRTGYSVADVTAAMQAAANAGVQPSDDPVVIEGLHGTQVYRGDGTLTIEHSDRSYERYYPDGRSLTRDKWGRQVTYYPEDGRKETEWVGRRVTVWPGGKKMTEDLQTGERETVFPNGSSVTEYAEGGKLTVQYDGTTVLESGGVTVTTYKDGREVVQDQNYNYTTTYYPNGNRMKVYTDGSVETVTKKPGGIEVHVRRDGTVVTYENGIIVDTPPPAVPDF